MLRMANIDFHGQVTIVTGAGLGLVRSHAKLLVRRNSRDPLDSPQAGIPVLLGWLQRGIQVSLLKPYLFRRSIKVVRLSPKRRAASDLFPETAASVRAMMLRSSASTCSRKPQ